MVNFLSILNHFFGLGFDVFEHMFQVTFSFGGRHIVTKLGSIARSLYYRYVLQHSHTSNSLDKN